MNTQKHIFIVDDDPLINILVVKRFTSEGYRVTAFKNGEDCLKALTKKPNVVILDYLFVNKDRQLMNGMEIFNRIKELSPDTPVIMLSGQEKGELVLEFARKGIDDYIIKDNNLIDNLLIAVTDLFKGR